VTTAVLWEELDGVETVALDGPDSIGLEQLRRQEAPQERILCRGQVSRGASKPESSQHVKIA
jgi:hypothetical protein